MGELETIIGMPGKRRVITAACGTTLIENGSTPLIVAIFVGGTGCLIPLPRGLRQEAVRTFWM